MLEMKNPYTIYRGAATDLEKFLKDVDTKAVGGTYTFPNLLSCTRDPTYAWHWHSTSDVFLEIRTLADSRAITITEDLEPEHNEWETTLDWGQTARVDEIKWVDTRGKKRPVVILTMLPNTAGINPSNIEDVGESNTKNIPDAQMNLINNTGEWIPAKISSLNIGQEIQISPEVSETYGNSGTVDYIFTTPKLLGIVSIINENGKAVNISEEFLYVKNPDFNAI